MPWGPHGQEAPPNTVRPNPTTSSPGQQLGGGGDGGGAVGAGGGAGGGFFANVILSLVLVFFLWIPMVCLYPLTAAAGLVVGFGAFPLLVRVLPPDGRDVATLAAVILGVIVAYVVNRRESRLAEHQSFRLVRHVVRLALLSVWAIPIIQLTSGATAPSTSTRYILATISNPRALTSFLGRPQNLAIWLVVIVALHFLLWQAEGVRRWWHRRLRFIGLR